jgi:hypothetical protein
VNLFFLFAAVAIQIVVFQFFSTRLTRALPDYRLGVNELPGTTAQAVHEWKRKAGAWRTGLGAILAAAAVLFAFALPLDTGGRKLGLAAVSLLSSAAFAYASWGERRAMNRLAASLPEARLRSADLSPRTLRTYYPPWLEAIPVAAFLATIAITVAALPDLAHGPGANEPGLAADSVRLWILPFFQGTYVALLIVLTWRLVTSACAMPQGARSRSGSPEDALRLDARLRALRLRGLLGVKIAITFMVGAMQLERLQEATRGEAAALVSASVWIFLMAALAAFAMFLVRLPSVKGNGAS